MKRSLFMNLVIILALAVPAGAHAASVGDTWFEGPDAGDVENSPPQQTDGTGALNFIKGNIADPQGANKDVDIYCIHISDFENFSAETIRTNDAFSTLFDTQLWLFDENLKGVYANDDKGSVSNQDKNKGINTDINALSLLPAGHEFGPESNGCYFLAITGFNMDAKSSPETTTQGGLKMFSNSKFTDVMGPNNDGSLASWTGSAHFNVGNYTIKLTGAQFCSECDENPGPIPEPATACLLGLGLVAAAWRRKRAA
ncbi:MAG TPA: PEP-CTERM sorting domain-containing protein [Planctomycetota bacterium]|nr:PEP-CTERM sorting domain-containing protein [Planctomycetota bacterium]